MRGAVRRAWPHPLGVSAGTPPRPRPGPSPARALAARSHTEPEAAAAQVGPAPQRPEMQREAALCLRLWLCLGLLDGERGEPAARASARLAARGDTSPGRRGMGWGGALDPREPGAAGETGLGARGYGRRWSTAVRAWALRDQERAGGDQPGQGPGTVCTTAEGLCSGSSTTFHCLWLSSLGAWPHRTAFSDRILRLLTSSPAESRRCTALPSDPRATGTVSR